MHLHFTCIKIHTFEVKCSWHLTHNHITEESWCQHFHCTIPKNSKKILFIWLFRLFLNHSDRNEAVYIIVQEWISWPKFSLGVYSFWSLTIPLFTLVLILLIIHGIGHVRVLYSFTHFFSYITRNKMLFGIITHLWDLFLIVFVFCALRKHDLWGKREEIGMVCLQRRRLRGDMTAE